RAYPARSDRTRRLEMTLASPVLAGPPPEAMAEARLFAGRFRVSRTLKKGNGIETLLATDLDQGQQVIIKAASDKFLSVGAQMRLEHEAGVLRHIRTEGLAPLVHLGREDNLLFLVMAFVPGITLEKRLSRGALSVRDTVSLGSLLLRALQGIHDHGVL